METSYLSGQSEAVKAENALFTSFRPLIRSVPQGFVLGPLLFVLLIAAELHPGVRHIFFDNRLLLNLNKLYNCSRIQYPNRALGQKSESLPRL